MSLGYAARRLHRDERDLVEEAINGKLEIWGANNRHVSIRDDTPAMSTSASKGPADDTLFDIDLDFGRATKRIPGPFLVPPVYLALVHRGDPAFYSGTALFADGSTQVVESLFPLSLDTLCVETATIEGEALRGAESARSATRLATETAPASALATTPPPSRSARQRRADARSVGTILMLLLEEDVRRDPTIANQAPKALAERVTARFGSDADRSAIASCINAVISDVKADADQDLAPEFIARVIEEAAEAAACRIRGRVVPTRLANKAGALGDKFPGFSIADEKTLQRWLSKYLKSRRAAP